MRTPFILLILSPAASSVCSFQAHSPLLYFLLLCSDSCTWSDFSTSLTSDLFSSSLASVGICGLHFITLESKPQPAMPPLCAAMNTTDKAEILVKNLLLGSRRHFPGEFVTGVTLCELQHTAMLTAACVVVVGLCPCGDYNQPPWSFIFHLPFPLLSRAPRAAFMVGQCCQMRRGDPLPVGI